MNSSESANRGKRKIVYTVLGNKKLEKESGQEREIGWFGYCFTPTDTETY
jgi:hypothetical protein